MIKAFMYGREWEDDSFGEYDLKVGIQYCQDLMMFEKLQKEPFHGYDLQEFINWASKRLSPLPQDEVVE